MHGNIKYLVDIDNGAEPIGVQIARIGEDKHGAAYFAAKAQRSGLYLERRRGEHVLER